jgi:hypothetical protein
MIVQMKGHPEQPTDAEASAMLFNGTVFSTSLTEANLQQLRASEHFEHLSPAINEYIEAHPDNESVIKAIRRSSL